MTQGQGSLGEYEEGLQQAMLIQGQLLEAVRGDNPEMVAAHKQAAAAIQTELAGLYATQHKLDQVTSLCYPLCVCLCLCLSVATHLPKHVWLGVGSRPPPPFTCAHGAKPSCLVHTLLVVVWTA